MTKILYIEDEHLLGRIVQESLESRGYQMDWYTDGDAAEKAIQTADNYDLAVLDVMLPGSQDGFAIGASLRKQLPNLPIIYLTARTQSKDVVMGFQAGANDYLRKPFSMEELIVRIENQLSLRRPLSAGSTMAQKDIYQLSSLTFDYARLELKTATQSIQLSNREGELLRYFAERIDQTIERKQLLLDLWQDDGFFHSRNLDVYVRKLRQYLAADPMVRIITLRGVGYRVVVE